MRDRRLHDRFGVFWQVHPWLAEPGRAVGYFGHGLPCLTRDAVFRKPTDLRSS